jgi:PAS domain S-box-containing protein
MTSAAPLEDGGTGRGPARRRLTWLLRDEGWEPGEGAARLLACVLIAGVAVALKLVIVRWLGGELGYLSYVGAVALGAWIAGFRGGLLTTVVCALAEAVLFGGSPQVGGPLSANAVFRLSLFVFDGILVSFITSQLRKTTHREREALARSERLLRETRDTAAAIERSQGQLAALQTATASLAGAATPLDVADAILDRGLEILGAVAGAVSRLDASGTTLEVVASRGYPDADAHAGLRHDLQAGSPLMDSIATGDPIFLGSMEEWLSRYPESPPRPMGASPVDGALAILPLVSGASTVGLVVFRFAGRVEFGAGVSELAMRLEEQGAQAMDRALAYDRERHARLALERSRDRLAFLARVSERLAAPAEIGQRTLEVAELAVPLLADWCIIQLARGDRPVIAIAVPRADQRPLVEDLASLAPMDPGLGAGPALDVAPGGATLVVADPDWAARFADPRAVAALEGLGTRALLVAPIGGPDGGPAGSVMLGGASADRFDATDMPLVRDLAERVATAARQAALLAVVTRFKTSVDASADAVFMFDPDTLRLTYVNRGGADLAGSEPERMLGQRLASLQPTLDGAMLERLRSEAAGRRLPYSSSLQRSDGRSVPIEALLQEVPVGDGTTTIVLTARDISDRLDVQARLTRIAGDERRQAAELRAVIHAMHEGVVVVGPDGTVSLANEAAMAIFGGELPANLEDLYSRIGMRRDRPAGDGPDDGRDEDPRDVMPVAERRATVRLEDGRWLETAVYTAELGSSLADGATSTIVVVRDVSRAKEAEAAREAFLGVLSHELRTPVTTIYGYAKVLQRPSRRAGRREMLNDIEVEADRLYRIVEDLLALSRVEGGVTIEGEPLLVQHIVEPLIASEARRWPGVRYEADLPAGMPAVRGERTYVEQVLRNLLSNAGKYGSPGSVVTIAADVSPSEIVVRIMDRGIGIAPEEADRLFDLYYRSPTSARSASGAGIGLYVARGLVTAMGGRIWARPRDGGGSEFSFSLPRFHDDAPPPAGGRDVPAAHIV